MKKVIDKGDYIISPNGYKYYEIKKVPEWILKKTERIARNSINIYNKYFFFKGKMYRYCASYQSHYSGTNCWFYWKRKIGAKK